MKAAALIMLLALTGCYAVPGASDARGDSEVLTTEFPLASRPVSPIVSSRWSTEEARDKANEADQVMNIAGINPGMTVADIGAGEGYYTIRLANRVGPQGRVLAQDVIATVRDTLANRVNRERLDNVSVKLGTPEDPKLPANSFDRILMVHMYHEIEKPLEFLWRMRPALRVGGRVVVVEGDRSTQFHGTPPALLVCELRATGYHQIEIHPMPQIGGYLAVFEASGKRPEPAAIKPCTPDGPKKS
jgi:ubiquinone/menaquinone biosynthesis C-methylase UbiE